MTPVGLTDTQQPPAGEPAQKPSNFLLEIGALCAVFVGIPIGLAVILTETGAVSWGELQLNDNPIWVFPVVLVLWVVLFEHVGLYLYLRSGSKSDEVEQKAKLEAAEKGGPKSADGDSASENDIFRSPMTQLNKNRSTPRNEMSTPERKKKGLSSSNGSAKGSPFGRALERAESTLAKTHSANVKELQSRLVQRLQKQAEAADDKESRAASRQQSPREEDGFYSVVQQPLQTQHDFLSRSPTGSFQIEGAQKGVLGAKQVRSAAKFEDILKRSSSKSLEGRVGSTNAGSSENLQSITTLDTEKVLPAQGKSGAFNSKKSRGIVEILILPNKTKVCERNELALHNNNVFPQITADLVLECIDLLDNDSESSDEITPADLARHEMKKASARDDLLVNLHGITTTKNTTDLKRKKLHYLVACMRNKTRSVDVHESQNCRLAPIVDDNVHDARTVRVQKYLGKSLY